MQLDTQKEGISGASSLKRVEFPIIRNLNFKQLNIIFNFIRSFYLSLLTIRWSPEGRKKDQQCIQWYAKEGRDGWNDNFLCLADKHPIEGSTVKPPNAQIPGGWAAWNGWSRCTKACGGGKKRRLRMCSNPKPQYGGKYCEGSPFQDKECNTQECRKSCVQCYPVNTRRRQSKL